MDSFKSGGSKSSSSNDEEETSIAVDREAMTQLPRQFAAWPNVYGGTVSHTGIGNLGENMEAKQGAHQIRNPYQSFESQFLETQRLINEQQQILLQSQARMMAATTHNTSSMSAASQISSIAAASQISSIAAASQNSSMAAAADQNSLKVGAGSVLPALFPGGILATNSLPHPAGLHRFDSSLSVGRHSNMEQETFARSALGNDEFAAAKRQKTGERKMKQLFTDETKQSVARASNKAVRQDQQCDLEEFAPFLKSLFPVEQEEERSAMSDSTSDDSCDLSECIEDVRVGKHSSEPFLPGFADGDAGRLLDLQGKLAVNRLQRGLATGLSSSFCGYETQQPLSGDECRRLLSSAPNIGNDQKMLFASSGCKKKKPAKKRNKKPKDMPRRPLSGYNLFFKDERAKVLAEKGKLQRVNMNYGANASPQIKVGFERLAQIISRRWNALSEEDRLPYKARAAVEMKRYREEMEVYKEKTLQQKTAMQTQESISKEASESNNKDSSDEDDKS